MEQSETQKVLDKFKDYVIQQSKSNLTRLKKNSSRTLYDSIKGNAKAMPNSFSLEFFMEDYGHFQDKGVSGIKKKYDTDYSYRSKMPPTKSLDKWIVNKGIAPRDKNGKFIDRKSLKFLIARSIFINGIKPSLFFTKPFERAFKNLPNELIESYSLDVIELFRISITQPKK
jgi:hypothetical protein